MRRIVAALAAVALALGFTVALASPAAADITQPGNGATLRGTVTLAADGAYEDTCLFGGGSGPRTQLQLLRSNNSVARSETKNGEGSFSYSLDTHAYPNGSYKVRSIERNRDGFFRCDNPTDTDTHNVTIDNISGISYTGATSAPRNTSVTVSATLTDPNKNPKAISGELVTFKLSGGATVTDSTNSSGVASATLPVTGNARSATIQASFAGTDFFESSSVTKSFAVTKNSTATTLAQPAPVVHGQTTSFSATVAPTNGTGVPSGTVQFTVDGDAFGPPVALVGGAAGSQSTSTLGTGNHIVGAVYNGDDGFIASTAATKTQVVNKAVTTTALTSDISPTVSGQTVTFTAEVGVVAPGVGTPTGGVQFNIDGEPFGTAEELSGNTASISVSDLSTDNHTVEAVYNGNDDFASSSSAELTHGVDKAEAALALSTNQAAAVAGEPITFTADLSAVGPGAGTPTGVVQFAVDGEALGAPVAVTGGSATSPVANLDAGTHLITADYTGDANFGGAMDSLEQQVDAAATTTSVSSSPNPSVVGQTVVLRAEVRPVSPATGTPQGAAQFYVDGVSVGFVELQGGVAEYSISTLAVGGHTVKAKYASTDTNFIPSTSTTVGQQVNKAATKTSIVSSSPTSVFGQPVTFTATVGVAAPGAGAPSGEIVFTDGTTVLATKTVDSSTNFEASFTTDQLSVAQHAIVATYNGNDSFLGSTGSVVQKVQRAQTTTTVTSSANPSQSGQGVTFSASVAAVAPAVGNPTGTVRFTVNGANLGGPATIVDGVATSNAFVSLSPGTYAIEATYSGDGNFVNSSGSVDQGNGQDVAKGATEMTLESSDDTADFAQPVTFTSTVSAVAPATGRPSGVVQIWEGPVLLGATSLAPAGPQTATAEFVTSTLSSGDHEIRAVYVGNFNFEGQTASTSQSVGQVPTVTGLQSSVNPSTFGDPVTLTAVVSASVPAVGAPSGTVTFTEGGSVLGTGTISSVQGRQVASITVDELAGGAHDITATYSGDAAYAGSTSVAFTQVVERAASGLEAKVVLRNLGDNGGRVRATLTGDDGQPLAGQTLVFDSTQLPDGGTIHICETVTDASGFAECDATSEVLAVLLFNNGYDVRFAGNADYLPAEDHQTYFFSGEE